MGKELEVKSGQGIYDSSLKLYNFLNSSQSF